MFVIVLSIPAVTSVKTTAPASNPPIVFLLILNPHFIIYCDFRITTAILHHTYSHDHIKTVTIYIFSNELLRFVTFFQMNFWRILHFYEGTFEFRYTCLRYTCCSSQEKTHKKGDASIASPLTLYLIRYPMLILYSHARNSLPIRFP